MRNGERASQELRLIVSCIEIMIFKQGYRTQASEGDATLFPMSMPEPVAPDAEFQRVTMDAQAQEDAALSGTAQGCTYQASQELPKQEKIG
jgi:hypothetical protein